MSGEYLNIQGLRKGFDGIKALDGFSCSVERGEIVGFIGPNGAGKTTLFNVLTGFLTADGGTAIFRGHGLLGKAPHVIAATGIARTFQNLRLIRRMTVLENVLLCYQYQPGEHLTNIFFRWRANALVEARNREAARSLLASVGLSKNANDLSDSLSYGQQKLLSMACCLATGAELLLFDEPVAGISPQAMEQILAIIQSLPAQGKSVMLIEHNMDAVTMVCNRVIFMDSGVKVCEGTPQEVRNDPRVIEAYIN